ncbi:effector-associated domain EAD1-containing protein [Scytonema sp. PCC 10023]|uniref:effector-associated domain EAD1-containing protein n=1 Tax=Scytonema sp. PCC 10023 TaxID=1680591 RepID=UPI0039C61138
MPLNGIQFRQLQLALLSAFPNRAKLKQMVRFGLEENLDAIATGENDEEVVFQLIDWAESNGNLENLLIAARNEDCGGNSGNSQLKRMCEELLKIEPTIKQPHTLLNPCYFDLDLLIEECLLELEEKRVLFGLSVPCDDDAFRESFCQRLKDEVGRRNIQIKRPLTLNPLVNSVDRAVRVIEGYKQLLHTSNIICPIQVQVFDQNSSIPDDFWLKISATFRDNLEHCLIMIMLGSEDSIFPKRVIKLKPPKFTKAHIHRWVVKATTSRGWAEQVMLQWKQKMIAGCCLGNPESELLDIRSVYDYLDYTMQLLQQNISAEAFMEELEQRI